MSNASSALQFAKQPTIRVWYVKPCGSIKEDVAFIEGVVEQKVTLIFGTVEAVRSVLRNSLPKAGIGPVKVEETFGTEGLAGTNPNWDSGPTVFCELCKGIHSVHDVVAEILYVRSKGEESNYLIRSEAWEGPSVPTRIKPPHMLWRLRLGGLIARKGKREQQRDNSPHRHLQSFGITQ